MGNGEEESNFSPLKLEFKWTVSRARDSYGYNVVTLRVNDKKVASCNGGGYDMSGSVLGDFIATRFKSELLKLTEPFCGLSFHDPDYDPGKAQIEGETVEAREKEGKSLGLERYQAFHSASSRVPTERHKIPLIDGATGFNSVESIIKAIGYKLEFLAKVGETTIYRLAEKES